MRFNQQGTKKMVTDEQKAAVKPAVEKGAVAFAALEKSAKYDKKTANEVVEVVEAVRDAGVISPFECDAITARVKATAASHEADWKVIHNDLVRRCVDLGIDVPAPTDPDLPAPQSGGGSR